tara:strand:- start:976 stop:1515 length:540 start_codon:yes stop_codon:yes gene_type:complete
MSKGNIVGKTGMFIKNNKTAMLYIGGTIGVVLLASILYKRIKKVLNPTQPQATDKTVVDDIKIDDNKTTISLQQAKSFSNQLVGYFSISSGTDEDGIKSIFEKIKNKDDMNLLYKTFGFRPYSNTNQGEASGALWGLLENAGGYSQLDLLGWLDQELGVFDWRTKKVVNEKLELIGLSI